MEHLKGTPGKQHITVQIFTFAGFKKWFYKHLCISCFKSEFFMALWCWFSLFHWGAEKDQLRMHWILLPHLPALFMTLQIWFKMPAPLAVFSQFSSDIFNKIGHNLIENCWNGSCFSFFSCSFFQLLLFVRSTMLMHLVSPLMPVFHRVHTLKHYIWRLHLFWLKKTFFSGWIKMHMWNHSWFCHRMFLAHFSFFFLFFLHVFFISLFD